MTPKELKNSILQLAIEGKLVKQRKEEGSAETLYAEIQKEKQKLIKQGKIKKEKELLEITDDEIPFEIPKSWKWCRINEVVYFQQGIQIDLSKQKFEKFNNSVRFLRIINFTQNNTDYRFIDEKYSSDAVYINNSKLVMIRYGATSGNIYYGQEGVLANNLFSINTYINKILNSYLKLFFENSIIKSFIVGDKSDTAMPSINFTTMNKLIFPLPPFAEQKRIVEKIEELMPLVDRYEVLYNRLNELNKEFPKKLKNAVLQKAIEGKLVKQIKSEGDAEDLYREIQKEKQKLIKQGKLKKEKELPEITEDEVPFEIPKSWKWVKFGEIVNYNMGKTPPRAESQWWGNGMPWVSISDMSENGHIKSTKEFVTKEAIKNKFNDRISKKGTLLMSFKLTVGRVSILDIDAVHNEAIISIYPLCDENNIMQKYLFYILPLVTNWGDSKDAIKGKTLNDTSIKNLLISLPPLAEQKRIVEKINLLEKKISLLTNIIGEQ